MSVPLEHNQSRRNCGSVLSFSSRAPTAQRDTDWDIRRLLLHKPSRINTEKWASLVAHWLRIRLPMQGTQVRSLVQEDPTCHGATKPTCHNY